MSDQMADVKWVPVSVAVKLLGVSKQRVYKMIEKGVLMTRRVDRTWLISMRSLNDEVELRSSRGGEKSAYRSGLCASTRK